MNGSSRMSCFRIKVDLTRYFQDARQISWIYVDGTKMWQIDHVKKHIHKLFAIEEPFHLLLNDTAYLPPNEDVRILQENEYVVAIPGTGKQDEASYSNFMQRSNIPNGIGNGTQNENSHSCSQQEGNIQKVLQKISNVSNNICNKEVDVGEDGDENKAPIISSSADQTCDTPSSQDTSDHKSQSTSTGGTRNKKETTMYHSILEDTEMDTASESKATDSNKTEDCSVLDCELSSHRRKRIRRKKNKKNESIAISDISYEETKSKKPKVINSLIISSGKHIRFDELENEENNLGCYSRAEASRKATYQDRSLSKDLSPLLALRQSSTPLTFIRKTAKEVKVENTLSDVESNKTSMEIPHETINGTIKSDVQLNSDNDSKLHTNKPGSMKISNVSIKKELFEPEEEINYRKIDPEKLPVMKIPAKVGDIVAFKMLKIATDYTPQVSNFILAETLSYSPNTKVYNFKVIEGKDEIQLPMGKFTLPEDETEAVVVDTVILNHAQLIEPRLVHERISELSGQS